MSTSSELRYQEAVRRAKSVDAAVDAFRQPSTPVVTTKSSSGIGQILIGADLLPEAAQAKTHKAERSALHARVQPVAKSLDDNEVRLLDFVVRKDQEYRGARLVDADISIIASVLGINKQEAEIARSELERRDLIYFYDNYSGERGFRPRV